MKVLRILNCDNEARHCQATVPSDQPKDAAVAEGEDEEASDGTAMRPFRGVLRSFLFTFPAPLLGIEAHPRSKWDFVLRHALSQGLRSRSTCLVDAEV